MIEDFKCISAKYLYDMENKTKKTGILLNKGNNRFSIIPIDEENYEYIEFKKLIDNNEIIVTDNPPS
jgi:hypothetical protein